MDSVLRRALTFFPLISVLQIACKANLASLSVENVTNLRKIAISKQN